MNMPRPGSGSFVTQHAARSLSLSLSLLPTSTPFFKPPLKIETRPNYKISQGMQNLPPGWRVSNSEGSYSGPSRTDDNEDSLEEPSDSELDENPDTNPDSPGWEDVDPDADVETVAVKCLMCDEVFHDAGVMLDHCRSEHSFDFLEIRRLHDLDFYATIRLVNFIRLAVKEGRPPDVPDLADPSLWADEKFLQPVLEADALLFSLDELIDFAEERRDEDEPMAVDTDGLENGHR